MPWLPQLDSTADTRRTLRERALGSRQSCQDRGCSWRPRPAQLAQMSGGMTTSHEVPSSHQREQQEQQQHEQDCADSADSADEDEPLDQTQPRARHVTIAEGYREDASGSPSASPASHGQRAASVHWQPSSSSSSSSSSITSRQKSSQGASTSQSKSSASHATRAGRKAAIPRMRAYKPSPAQQVQAVFKEVLNLLEVEWPTIRSLNLGVLSGTAVVEDVMMKRLKQLTGRLHTLTIERDEAADMLAGLVKAMPKSQFQQLQVLMDSTDHTELSDYLRLTLYNSSDPFAGASKRPPSYFGSRKTQRMTSAGAGSLSSRSLMGSMGGTSDGMSMLRASSSGMSAGHSYNNSSWLPSNNNTSNNEADAGLRFAARLPPGHALVAMAQSLKREHDFQRVLREAAEQAEADRAELEHMDHVLLFDDGQQHGTGEAGSSRVFLEHMRRTVNSRGSTRTSRPGSSTHTHHHQHHQHPSPPHSPTIPNYRFAVPLGHIEDLWAAGRKAQAVAVRQARGGRAAAVESESMLGTLLLAPPLGVCPRVLKPVVQESPVLSASGSGIARRASGVPALPLDRRGSVMPLHMAKLAGAGSASGRMSIGGAGAARTGSGLNWMASRRDTRGPSVGGAGPVVDSNAEGGSKAGVSSAGGAAVGHRVSGSGSPGVSPRSSVNGSSGGSSSRGIGLGPGMSNAEALSSGATLGHVPPQREHGSSTAGVQRSAAGCVGSEQEGAHQHMMQQSIKRRPMSGLGRTTHGVEAAAVAAI